MLLKGDTTGGRHETVVEIDRAQIEEMLRAYLTAKFQIPTSQFHDIRLTVLPDKFVVRVIDPRTNPIS